ncbi:MAG: DNA topoisomerase (ATP-hydrolyzing) [Phycisphaeraceae bacterium]
MAKRRRKKDSKDNDTSLFTGGGGSSGDGGTGGNGGDVYGGEGEAGDSTVPLHEAARSRYLNYALSVITSRALPDVRDGLKPVQRRILFTMWQAGLTFDAKHKKSAKVVGDVLGSYHPHGDSSVYDALVRMAQPWVMRAPLIDGSGNFGSMDGDPAAAYRYTECRLSRIADELLSEINQDTVTFRDNYDGTRQEPVVLPARIPHTLLNGSTGIAVGMATNIPPHNLGELCRALLKLLENPELDDYQLVANDGVQGPDFPTGGQVLNTRAELREIYKTGSGSIRLRGTWEAGAVGRGSKKINITSVPYGTNKAALVEEIGNIVISRKLPHLNDVKDISTTDVRIELDLKREADEQMVMAYLFKHTGLASNFAVNLTCLVPTENPYIGRPERIGLKQILWHFLHFRLDVVTRRLAHELRQLQRRIHLLEGFALVFDALDEIIKIIRKSEGKADAAEKIMARFKLDADQTDAILELKLYRLARLEILVIQEELKEKKKRAKEIQKLLDEDATGNFEAGRWAIVRDEIKEIIEKYVKGDPFHGKRRTLIEEVTDEPTFSADDFIIAEDNQVIVTRDGWVKRQKDIRDPSTTRLREGDSVLTAEAGSTRATMVFMSSFGVAYSCRIIDVPASTGHGEPIQKLFKLKDGERIIAAYSLDPRSIGDIGSIAAGEGASAPGEGPEEGTKGKKKVEEEEDAADTTLTIPPVHAVAATSDGYALRFSLAPFIEPSTRSGRKFARPRAGQEVVNVEVIRGDETLIAASRSARATLCPATEVNFLGSAGKGVILMKLAKDDQLIGFIAASDDRDTLEIETSMGGTQRINTAKYEVSGRGGKGREIIKRGQFLRVVPQPPSVPALIESDDPPNTEGKEHS